MSVRMAVNVSVTLSSLSAGVRDYSTLHPARCCKSVLCAASMHRLRNNRMLHQSDTHCFVRQQSLGNVIVFYLHSYIILSSPNTILSLWVWKVMHSRVRSGCLSRYCTLFRLFMTMIYFLEPVQDGLAD
ncbi:U1 [Hyposoter didymator ichnovirus]|nr:U1 [Hyposoter didymator ichnovirus]